ncbi:hypothetical protein [Streptomyces sp. NBC_00354]|uniref:hypothetical protein n=1 Tax=Streptomyces sp. NBC_00354 TaxID=2975723 RepID=UPI002E25C717
MLPADPVFFRFGRDHMQPLRNAIGNLPRDAAIAGEEGQMKVRQEEQQEQLRRATEQKKAEPEAIRPVCVNGGTRFDNDPWRTPTASP